ncbi:MAG: ABC transporter ATP-binding protein [bacterium]|jgi:ATP-binding cassette subfamily B multidrug efflux pump
MDTKQSNQSFDSPMRVLMRYLRPVALQNISGVLALVAFSYIAIQVPRYIKELINQLEGIRHTVKASSQGLEPSVYAAAKTDIFYACLIILVLGLLSALLLFAARWLIIGASRQIEKQMRDDLFAHIEKLTPRFYQSYRTGDLITRFASDIEQVRLLLGPGIMYPGQTCLLTLLALYYMFMLSTSLALTLLIPIGVLLIYVNFNTRQLHKVYRQSQDLYSDMTAKMQENFSGIRVIKAYCQEEAEYERIKEINQRYVEKNIEQIKLRGRLFPFMNFIGKIGIVLILWRGGLLVIEGNNFNLGELVQFAIYYQMLIWPIIALGWIINVIHRGMASWRRIHGILETQPEVFVPQNGNPEPQLQGEIEVRNLTFSYEPERLPVLKHISFHVKKGQTLAIVGPTGCGKSTIVNLLLHLYQIPPGHIFYDGLDINEIPVHVLRESIAYVSQEVFLFSTTIKNNILFGMKNGRTEISENDILEAAEQAQLARDLESFPEGYETEIGERGITLSGGQKQRTGIARALILNRPILILDDCLSAVDTDTEEAILRGLRDAMNRRTAIVISHRISTVKYADHILVLDDGVIVEQGNHETLLEKEGLYYQMYNRQLLEDSLGIRT